MRRRPSRTFVVLLSAAACLAASAVYATTYIALRASHDLVRDATYYTGTDGTRVRTDTIRLGEWRAGPHWQAVALVFAPAMLVEERYWRAQ